MVTVYRESSLPISSLLNPLSTIVASPKLMIMDSGTTSGMMNDLVYKSNDNQALTNSLLVAGKFGKRHSDVLRSIETIISQTPKNQSERNFALSEYRDASGKANPMYIITKDGFSILVMGFTGETAMSFKWEYIEAFNKMEATIRTGGFNIPSNLKDALRLALQLEERKELLEGKVKEDAPKVLFAEAVSASKRSCLVSELAKIIQQNGIEIGQNRLFKWMRVKGYLCSKGESYNQPTQKAMELGLFDIKKTTIIKPDGTVMISTTSKVTGKGQIYFINKFIGENQNG